MFHTEETIKILNRRSMYIGCAKSKHDVSVVISSDIEEEDFA